MCSFKWIYFVIFILNLSITNAQISDKRLCVDSECKKPVSLAKTLLRYRSFHPQILSFSSSLEIKIYSKEAGSNMHLWGAEVGSRRGYIPKIFVREYKLIEKPTLLVDTEFNQTPQVPIESSKENVQPNKIQESFEVVDGTTIYLGSQDNISPSSTESPVLSTAKPLESNEVVQETDALKFVEKSDEKDGSVNENMKRPFMNNTLSIFSNETNEENSEEVDDTNDGIEEDEDENEDGAVEQENIEKNSVDINSLHNLPQQVIINGYTLEIEKSELKVDKDINKMGTTQNLPDETVSFQKVQNNLNYLNDAANDNKDIIEEKSVNEVSKVKEDTITDLKKNAESAHKELKGDEDELQINYLKRNKDVKEEVKIAVETKMKSTAIGVESKIEKPVNENLESSSGDSTKPQQISNVETNINQNSLHLNSSKDIKLPGNFVEIGSETPDETVTEKSSSENSESISKLVSSHNISADSNKVLDKIIPSAQQISVNGKDVSDAKENMDLNEKYSNNQHRPSNFKQEDKSLNENLGQEIKTDLLDTDSVEDDQENSKVLKENANVDFPFSPGKEYPEREYSQEEKTETISISSEKSENTYSQKQKYIQEEITIEDISNELPSTDVPSGDVTVSNVTQNNYEEYDVETAKQIENNFSKDEVLIDNLHSDLNQAKPSEYLHEDTVENNDILEDSSLTVDYAEENPGIFTGFLDFFKAYYTSNFDSSHPVDESNQNTLIESQKFQEFGLNHCESNSDSCNLIKNSVPQYDSTIDRSFVEELLIHFTSDIFLYLITTAISVILFMFGYLAFDRHKREAPLVARINKLEKELLVTLKENELLQEKSSSVVTQEVESFSNEVIDQLNKKISQMVDIQQILETKIVVLETDLEGKEGLEEQIESLEKELETSTEVGMELNRIISEMLDPTNGSEKLKENVEQLQRQLLEQKDTINTINGALKGKEAENKKLLAELDESNKQVSDMHGKLNELADKILKIEKAKDQEQVSLQNKLSIYRQKYSDAVSKENTLNNDLEVLKVQLATIQREAELKTKEYQSLKESVQKIKSIKNDSNAIKSIFDATSVKAELQQSKTDSEKYLEQLQQERLAKVAYERKCQAIMEEVNILKQNYELADKEKVEINSKLEVLTNYFKKKEAELQEEIIKYKSIWDAKEGEATSITERIKYMQEEIENYKAQNETLKQEIISQEIELKSQISVLEKKVHENWVTSRQMERKLEDTRQESAQLRNRLTLRERAVNDHNRLQSPMEQNGDLTLSPHPIDSPASPPLLFGARDHITKSPPVPGLPPFLPPPPGAPFMPPLHGMPPFIPPPPSMFPGDHRPPPLGRMSSPPMNSRYSPDTSAFSPYDRHSPSPPYNSEYGASPPPLRGYSPYRDDRRDYKRPSHARTNGRNMKGSLISSGSDHSNDSFDKMNRKSSKMV